MLAHSFRRRRKVHRERDRIGTIRPTQDAEHVRRLAGGNQSADFPSQCRVLIDASLKRIGRFGQCRLNAIHECGPGAGIPGIPGKPCPGATG
jgi:hypothetical protein